MILREYEKETSESIAWCQWPRNEQLNVSFFFLKGMFYSPNRKAKKPPFPGGGGSPDSFQEMPNIAVGGSKCLFIGQVTAFFGELL